MSYLVSWARAMSALLNQQYNITSGLWPCVNIFQTVIQLYSFRTLNLTQVHTFSDSGPSATINFWTLALIQPPVHNVQTPNYMYTYLFGIKLSCVLLISFKVVQQLFTCDVYCASTGLFLSHSQAESMNICYKYVTGILAIKE